MNTWLLHNQEPMCSNSCAIHRQTGLTQHSCPRYPVFCPTGTAMAIPWFTVTPSGLKSCHKAQGPDWCTVFGLFLLPYSGSTLLAFFTVLSVRTRCLGAAERQRWRMPNLWHGCARQRLGHPPSLTPTTFDCEISCSPTHQQPQQLLDSRGMLQQLLHGTQHSTTNSWQDPFQCRAVNRAQHSQR